MTVLATLIGDVVGSRHAADRSRLHERLRAAVAHLNATQTPLTPVRITVGDEYQGCFATVGAALRAALLLRLALAPDVEVRHGIGWGEVEVLQAKPRVEDGPGWWAARAAIEEVERAEQVRATRMLRTAYAVGEGATGTDPAAVNAALLAHDVLLADAGERGLSVVRGMLLGMSQVEIAEELGITPSAVSQRVRGGLESLHAVEQLLVSVP